MDFWNLVDMYRIVFAITKQEAVQLTLKRYYIAQ